MPRSRSDRFTRSIRIPTSPSEVMTKLVLHALGQTLACHGKQLDRPENEDASRCLGIKAKGKSLPPVTHSLLTSHTASTVQRRLGCGLRQMVTRVSIAFSSEVYLVHMYSYISAISPLLYSCQQVSRRAAHSRRRLVRLEFREVCHTRRGSEYIRSSGTDQYEHVPRYFRCTHSPVTRRAVTLALAKTERMAEAG